MRRLRLILFGSYLDALQYHIFFFHFIEPNHHWVLLANKHKEIEKSLWVRLIEIFFFYRKYFLHKFSPIVAFDCVYYFMELISKNLPFSIFFSEIVENKTGPPPEKYRFS